MNVLVTATTFPNSISDGSPRFVYDLCMALAERKNIRPIILVPHSKGASIKEDMDGLTVFRYRYSLSKFELISGNGIVVKIKKNKLLIFLVPFLLLFQISHSMYLIKKYDIDVVLANWIVPQGLIAVIVKTLMWRRNLKVIIVSHGGDAALLKKNIILKKLASYILNRADSVVAVSHFIKNRLTQFINTPKDISVISMGVNTEMFRNKLSNINCERDFDVIFIGRLEPKKGISYLIEAIGKLKKRPDLRVVIIGDGSHKEELSELVISNGLQHNIEFTGSLSHRQVGQYLTKSRIFAAPSINLSDDTEGMPTVLLEAMAAGIPIITTDAGGIGDVVINSYNGLVVEQRNTEELAEKILLLLENPKLRIKLAHNGVKHVEQFTYKIISQKYEEIIRNADLGLK